MAGPRRRGRTAATIVAVALLLSYPALVAGALLASPWLFGGAAIIGYLAEYRAARGAPWLQRMLGRVQLGTTPRFLVREAALLVLLGRIAAPFAVLGTIMLGLLALHVVRGVHCGVALYVTKRRRLPVLTRGIDLSPMRIPNAPPRLLVRGRARALLYLDAIPVLATVAGAISGRWVLGPAAALLAIAVAAVAAGILLVVHVPRARRIGDRRRALDVVSARLAEYGPEIVLYFSGNKDSMYQVNMWLSTLERIDYRALIVLRERRLVPLLDRTRVPVICVPSAVDLMSLDLSSVLIALFPANVGKNIHMLRMPGVKHVFIGHGDSDKQASFNPFTKVYDEVWVAGQAGRQRYRRARVGVRDENVVEVGRPQLSAISRAGSAERIRTVLYAPTWEGWTDDLLHTSLVLMGPMIIRTLLDHDPALRVLYRPHPMTGVRNRHAKRAHRRIVAMINEANLAREGDPRWVELGDSTLEERAVARSRLAEIESRMSALASADRSGGDEAQRARDAAIVDPGLDLEWSRLDLAWYESYWRAADCWQHRVITGSRPGLYACFNRADLLITDISSVVADFLASGKPYAVTNVAGDPEADFKHDHPSASAAYLLSADCGELDHILAETAQPDDRLSGQRQALREYLLGPDTTDPLAWFNDALTTLVTKSRATRLADRVELDFAFDPAPPLG